MKKYIILTLTTFISIILCSCTFDISTDTYFIHAIGFDKENDEYVLLSVCEKFEKDNEDYFLIRQKGKDIEEAIGKTCDEYKNCYFATVKYYFIPSECDDTLIKDMAKEVCDSNNFPSKSHICMVSGQSTEGFMSQIKNGDDIKIIQKALDGKTVNTVKFLSHYTSGKASVISVLSLDGDGQIKARKKTISHHGKGEQNDFFKR